MSFRTRLPILAAGLLCATATAGCLTPHVKAPPSQAILQARAAHEAKPAACATGALETVSPVNLDFPFDEATISEVGQKRLADAAQWLGCNPGVEVVIKPDGESQGDAAHQNDLAQRRAQAAADQLRALGAKTAVVRVLARTAPDPVGGPHLLINAVGRGW
jgi:outer membrane protein OmpA-like peptidoglycan-associated protein